LRLGTSFKPSNRARRCRQCRSGVMSSFDEPML
jgi:hypothetical protein